MEILLLPQFSTISNCKYNVMWVKPVKSTDIAVNRWILFCPDTSAVDIIHVSSGYNTRQECILYTSAIDIIHVSSGYNTRQQWI